MRSIVIGSLFALCSSTLAAHAGAVEADAPAPSPSVSVCGVPPASAPAPAVEATAAPAVIPVPSTGLVLGVDIGMSFLGGGVVTGLPLVGLYEHTTARIGYFASTHLGLMTGIDIDGGSLVRGCTNDCTVSYGIAIPVYVQYAFTDRTEGAYLDAGVKFINAFGAYTADNAASPETLRMSSTFDGTFGIGYRFNFPADRDTHRASRTSLDLHLGADVGRFSHVRSETVGSLVEGDVSDEGLAFHYMFSIGGGYHWSL